MITFPLSFPAVGGIESLEFTPSRKVAATSSEFTNQDFVYAHQGDLMEMLLTTVLMPRNKAAEWIAFLLSLEGKLGTFLFGDPFNTTPRGVATGTPLIKGATETGQDINTDGWTPSTANIVRAGDPLQIGTASGSRLYTSLTDANSDSGGNALLTLRPAITVPFADNEVITMNSPKGVWRMTTNETPWAVRPDGLYKFTITAKEVR